jgi:hypothetical protein
MRQGTLTITTDRERGYVFIENRSDRTVTVDLNDIAGGVVSVPPDNVYRVTPKTFEFILTPSGGLETINTSLRADGVFEKHGLVVYVTTDWQIVRAERRDGRPVDLADVERLIDEQRSATGTTLAFP